MNEQIRAENVQLITQEGENIGVVTRARHCVNGRRIRT